MIIIEVKVGISESGESKLKFQYSINFGNNFDLNSFVFINHNFVWYFNSSQFNQYYNQNIVIFSTKKKKKLFRLSTKMLRIQNYLDFNIDLMPINSLKVQNLISLDYNQGLEFVYISSFFLFFKLSQISLNCEK